MKRQESLKSKEERQKKIQYSNKLKVLIKLDKLRRSRREALMKQGNLSMKKLY